MKSKLNTFLRKSSGLLAALALSAVASAQTPIYVNDISTTGDAFTSSPGNDLLGNGSRSAPYATITKAMTVAASGNVIYVDAGTYNQGALTIKSGVRLIGLCPSSTTISVLNSASSTITLASNSELSRFTVTRQTPTTSGGPTTVTVATTTGGSNMRISNCFFTKNRTAIYINSATAASAVTIENNDFDDNRTGIIMPDASYANIRINGNNIVNNRSFGVLINGASSLSNIVISNNNITGNLASNLEINGTAAANSVTLTGNWFGTASPMVYAAITNGGFNVDDHNTGSSYPYNFTDNNGAALPNYPNDISGNNTAAINSGTATYAAAARTVTLPGCCVVTSNNPVGGFLTIQEAVNNSNSGATIMLCAGTYNEQVLVNKSVTIKGAGTLQSIVNFTGTVSGKPTLFDVSQPNVTIENIDFKVDLTKLSSAIIASGTNVNNLSIKDNKVEASGSSAAASVGSYGNRNAISINYGGPANYRAASGGVNNVLITGNTVTATPDDGFGVARIFRSAVSMDEGGGTFSNNTMQSVNHDVLVRFGGNGAITVSNNNFNGGGVELAEMNAGAGTLTVSGNTFDATASNVLAPSTAVLRLKNANAASATIVSGNNFINHEWAVSLENYKNVTLDNNSFTPLAGSTAYHHITINTKTINTTSASVATTANGATLTNNTFNGSGAAGGTALGFYHHNTAGTFGSFVIGTAGNENKFNAGIANFIYLDHQSGASGSATFPPYSGLIGSGAGATTTMAPWPADLNAANNKFDVGSGLQTPASMSAGDLFALEDRTQHKIDYSSLGFVTMKASNAYVTTNSFVAPLTTVGSIQRGVDAASNGWVVNVAPGTFVEDVNINKGLTVLGSGFSATTVSGAIGGDIATMRASAAGVIIDGFTITREGNNTTDWNNPGLNSAGIAVQGMASSVEVRNNRILGNRTGIDVNNSNGNNIHNNIIDDNRTGLLFRNQTDNTNLQQNFIRDNWTVGVLFIDASGGTNSPVQSALNSNFNDNNISGNWYGDVVDRQSGGSLPAPGTTNLKNFTCNWYGTTSPTTSTANSTEPSYATQIPVAYGGTATPPGGQPNILGPASANITYTPWLVSGADDAAAISGFQPVAGSCTGNGTAPTIHCPADITVTCPNHTDPDYTGTATANTNCGLTSISYTDVTTPGSNANNFTITRTWKATDACNNSSTCDQMITVDDDPSSLAAYTLLAEKEVKLDDNNDVYNGSVGATATNGKVSIDKYGSVASPGAFVHAAVITVNSLANAPITYSGPAPVTMPSAMLNTTSTAGLGNLTVNSNGTVSGNYKDVTVNNNVTVTLTGTTFRNIKIKNGASVTFTVAAGTVNINDLDMDDNSSLSFGNNANVLVSGNVTIGKNATVNGDGKAVTLHVADPNGNAARNFDVGDNGTSVTANVILPKGKLFAKGGNNMTTMKGQFIAEKIQAGMNVQWYGSNCESASSARMIKPQPAQAPTAIKENGILVYPNPTSGEFTVRFEDVTKSATVRIMDIQGRVMEQRNVEPSQMPSANFNLSGKSAGIYLIEVFQDGQHQWSRLVVQ